jgi:hypothetical protein
MASPQTHGLVTVITLLVLQAIGKSISTAELWLAIGFGVAIDIDHFTSWDFVKDSFHRIKTGGAPDKGVKIPIPWLHLWPGLILAVLTGSIVYVIQPAIVFYWPLVFWTIHRLIDYGQKNEEYYPHYHLLYPSYKGTWSIKWGYPAKPPVEFIIGSHVWMVVAIILFALLIAKS